MVGQVYKQMLHFFEKNCLPLFASVLSVGMLSLSCIQQEKEVAVANVSINQPSAEMIIGETVQLRATVTPSNATDKEITWISSSPSVCSVSEGLVTALSVGTSTITATAGGVSGSCVISVSFIDVTSVELDHSELSLVEGDEFTLKSTVKPDDATDKTVSWASSDSNIATVDANGKIKAIKEGQAIITARAGEKTADCRVSIAAKKIDVTKITLNKTSISMIVGEEQTIIATIIPDNATIQTVEWSTSDSSIATVEEGVITAIKEGNAKIVAFADGKTAECNVTVNYIPVQNITFDKTTLSLYEGEEYTLSVSIAPSNATYQDITWTSSDPKTATIDDGRVVAIKKGTATIKAEANGKIASCQVEVHSSMASISLNKNNLNLIVGDTETLTVLVSPDDATLRESVKWSSSDEKIVSVDQNGKVKAIKEGNAIISASVEGKKAECSVSVDYVHASSITLNQNEATLYIGDNLSLSATLYPNNVTYNTIEWSSSNNGAVTVSNTGMVTAVGKGTATVSAKSDGKEAKCTITVLVPLSGLSFDKNSLQLFDGQTSQLSVIITPNDATLKGDIKWNSSNTSVATVTNEGLVTAVKKGTASITATVDGYSASCPVEVFSSVTGISLNKTEATLNKGESIKLTYSITPSGATLQGQVAWKSSNTSIATVDNQGNVKAVGAGTADITVTLDGVSDTCKIIVVIPVNSVSLNKTNLELYVGDTAQLTATISPSDATDKTTSWKSSNTSVATVDNSGNVSAIGGGSTTITVTASGKTTSCNVAVLVPVSSITLNRTSATLNKNQTLSLTATIKPDNASDKTVNWESDTPLVAVVDQGGKVTAIGGGEAIISATAGDKVATCKITVKVPVSSVSLDKTSLTILKGGYETLAATVTPADATNKSLTWKSSSTSVATVDENGIVSAINGGNTTITVTSVDGGHSATCSVHVVSPPNNFAFKFSKVTIGAGMSVSLSLPSVDSYYKPFVFSSDNSSVAYYSESTNKLIGVSQGVATITMTTAGGEFSAAIEVTVAPYVDMGTSVKWSVCNLKSTTIEGYGGYYAWAETGDKSNTYMAGVGANPFNWYGYKYGTYPGTHILKYVFFYQNGMPHKDELRVLEPEDDAATVSLGSPWRMPSNAEWAELKANCTFTAYKVNSVSGVVVTSNVTGQSMFLPYAGYYAYDGNTSETQLYKSGSMCYYWTNELSSSVNSAAKAFYYPFNLSGYAEAERCIGLSVRAVYDD